MLVGGVNGTRPANRLSLFRIVNNWHQAFGVGGDYRGLAQTGVAFANAVFLFMIVSGLYIWITFSDSGSRSP